MPLIAKAGSPEKKQESRDAQKVLRLLARKLKPLGFERTKSTFFTRPSPYVVEFVHVHKFTFAPSFRVHFGARVRSDDSPAAHLNGPSSDEILDAGDPPRRKYEFDFDSSEASWEICAQAMYQCASSEGLEWFAATSNPGRLLSPDSPLTPEARAALQKEIASSSSATSSEVTQRVLNVA